MARLARLYIPGLPQLITQRGNNRNPLFLDETDYQQFLAWLRDALKECDVALHAYVLMPNHVHLLVTAEDAQGASRLMQRLGRRYVRWFNDRHRRTGTLWEGRYRSTVVDPAQWLLHAYRYVELNPVRAGLVPDAAYWVWSSARAHLGHESDPYLTDHAMFWALGNTPFDRQAAYRKTVEAGLSTQELEAIRFAAHRGWMLGDPPDEPGDPAPTRRARPLPKGRPSKAVTAD
ncbi:transposase [Niveibacterium microcysteis]|uniref:Transposase n=1 Tax=Niveibacterium microcysteis TaxID=2811415 RepID=A0ABX7M4U6_9RHOO|nr:transposase [Niveibacterium microcysteis]QSI76767.1 transposase [Niveibacterium microcysteis]